jgi:hypothetical protein
LSHIAPNVGVEKGHDYDCPDGLPGLAERIKLFSQLLREKNIILDIHSGDDLSRKTRSVIGEASSRNIHFKVSPALQLIFGETLEEYNRELFLSWWNDTKDYAIREAENGSSFAAQCLKDSESGDVTHLSKTAVFHHYSFAYIGKRDKLGQFVCREKFYDLDTDFYAEYGRRIVEYLSELSEDVL